MLQVEKFNVRVVNTGDKYGRFDCLTNDAAPMVEFYDSRYNHDADMGRGQFVSRYFVSTILGSEYPNGLSLDDGVSAWTVSPDGMRQVLDYLRPGPDDARLTKAAPELLSALEFVLSDLNTTLDPEAALIIRAAITKAKGAQA
jgi:hypothetical protein